MFRRLRLDFPSLEALQSEYQVYMEHGELFVPTSQTLGLREVVDLELGLDFCGRAVTLQAEVHGYRDWRGQRSAKAGVSVRLLEPIENLRLAVADSTGILFDGSLADPPQSKLQPPASPTATARSEPAFSAAELAASSESTSPDAAPSQPVFSEASFASPRRSEPAFSAAPVRESTAPASQASESALSEPALSEPAASVLLVSERTEPEQATAVPAAGPAEPRGAVRRSERSLARVVVSAKSGSARSEGATYDLSTTGALLVLEDQLPPIGDSIRLTLFHPTTDAMQEFQGQVVRHAALPTGETAVGVAFDFACADAEQARRFLDDVRAIEVDPRRRTETITGSIDVLGLPTLVQMFSASVGEGTITLVRGPDRGRIVFSGGELFYARTGEVTGVKALCRLLGWQAGVFHFAPTADEDEPEGDAPAMHQALFECIQKLDELARQDTSGFPRDQRLMRTSAEESELELPEKEVLAFIREGTTVGDVIDTLPGFDVDLYLVLERLLELGLIDLDIEGQEL